MAGKMKFTLARCYAGYIGNYGRFVQAIGAICKGQAVQEEAWHRVRLDAMKAGDSEGWTDCSDVVVKTESSATVGERILFS